jgi:hypothetical protein
MVFLGGIDEAGYGPFVGPLVLGVSLFRVHDPEADLWPVLERSCARKPPRGDRRLWVDDSKRVKSGPRGRERLERSVAAFREIDAPGRDALDEWLAEPPSGDARALHAAPWLRELPGALCPGADVDRARLDAAFARRDLDAAGCELQLFGARAVPAGEWNSLLERHRNKGNANFAVAMECVRLLLERTGDAPLRVELDRHGGRTRYGALLARALRPERIETHGETGAGSAYTLHFPTRAVELRFSEGADGRMLPVALASLAAKMTRERLTDLLNDWFTARIDGLKPTRGYGVDGKRWLAEVEPRLAALAVEPGLLRRAR